MILISGMQVFKSESDTLDCLFFFKEWIAKLNDRISNLTVLCLVVHKLGSSLQESQVQTLESSFFTEGSESCKWVSFWVSGRQP